MFFVCLNLDDSLEKMMVLLFFSIFFPQKMETVLFVLDFIGYS